ncbi:hypothetical protein LJC23_06535 [Desulfovibrio sp. OttesenSCG-928-I05]|nr:hypothetical protein [Desulfovibrio sp. OttesenSCG-928-I05]
MSSFRVGFLPLARVNFDMEAAGETLAASKALLNWLSPAVCCPDQHLSTYDMMTDWIKANGPFDFLIAQASTFIDPRFCLEYLQSTDCPVLLWGVREPSIAEGTRLKLNSLTGVFALSQLMYQLGRDFEFIYGNPHEEQVKTAIKRWLKAGEVASRVKNMKMGVIGSIPPGYFFSLEEEVMLRSQIGPQVVPVETYKLFKLMEKIDEPTRKTVFAELVKEVPAFAKLSPERQSAVAGFYQVVRNFIDENKLDAICGRCWPDSFEGLDIAFCSIYAMLSNHLPVGCEADQGGTLSLALLSWLADNAPAYLADPVALDEANDTMTYWHCGFGSPKLAKPGTEIDVVGHPNRKVPPSFAFPLKPGRVTLCRLGKGRNGYRLLIGSGESVDAPLQFSGTSAVVRMDGGSEKFVRRLADEGWEYHIALVYGDLREELVTLGRLLNVEVIKAW